MPPTKHARLGASGAERWMACPGSIRLTEGMVDHGSPDAWEGTAAHELAEFCLTHHVDPHDFIGASYDVWISDDVTTEIEVTHDMADAVAVFVEHVRERVAKRPGAVLHIERRGSLEPLNPPAPMFGTADVVLWDPSDRYLEVIDYKNGRGIVVNVVGNPQVRYYALIASVLEGQVPETIRTTIVQPRAFHPDGPIRHEDLTKEALIAFKHRLFEAAERTLEPDAPLQVGPWCKFCLAKATCPAQREHAVELIGTDFDFEVSPEAGIPGAPAPEDLTPEQLSVILERAGLVMDWLREVESYALTQAERGGHIPGFKLVEKRTNRRWKDEEAAEGYLARRGLKKDERTKSKVVSPNQAEQALKRAGLPLNRLEKLWESPEGAPKLVPIDDPREEIPSSVQQDFELLPPPDIEQEIEQPTEQPTEQGTEHE